MKLSEEKMNRMWLFDDSIIKRGFSIMGHYFIALLLIYGGLIGIWLVVAIIVKLLS